jgi:hypothetical protein
MLLGKRSIAPHRGENHLKKTTENGEEIAKNEHVFGLTTSFRF